LPILACASKLTEDNGEGQNLAVIDGAVGRNFDNKSSRITLELIEIKNFDGVPSSIKG
jgi:hypothetical protein